MLDVRSLCVALTGAVVFPCAEAEWRHAPRAGGEITARVNAAAVGVTMEGANLGRGRVNPDTGGFNGDPTWGEMFLQPIVSGTAGRWYGEVSAVGAITFGDGDPTGFTTGGDGRWDVETLFIGWRSGDPADDESRPVIDISAGRQTLNIGDGFVIDDGNFDAGDDGGVWLVPRQAFQRSLLARIDYRAAHADLFFLEADPDNNEPAFAGANLEYRFAGQGHLGLLYFHILDADAPTTFLARHGMDVSTVRVNDYRLPFAPQVALWGEAAQQRGEGRFGAFDSSAWYAETIYHFDLPWAPRLSYRYAYFSGDANPADSVRRDYDPLFYGFDLRSWGTWFQGEVTGGWLLFNSNQRNHLVHLAATPRDNLVVGMIGGTFELVESNYLGTPVADRAFSDEFNVYADWWPTPQVFVTGAYAVMFPRDGAIEAIGDDENYHVLELAVYFFY
ncbi:MAG: alginate export family protein [Gammaproteobacteria bacterium]